jgi:two-component system, NtrC family, sensor kinase
MLEQNLQRLNRLASIGILSASLAHEIKNALVPVRTYFELRKDAHDELTEIASQGLRRVESLVSQLLKYGGPAKSTPTLIHVHQIMDNALRLIQFQFVSKMVVLERSFAASSDCVMGDASQLEQAFSNVFLNALEAMSAGGQLTIITELIGPDAGNPAPRIRVRVSDTGFGVAPEDMPRLFDTFFTTKPHGTGLGLTITRHIIQDVGGTITVESASNKGTTFTITLPLKACENQKI